MFDRGNGLKSTKYYLVQSESTVSRFSCRKRPKRENK